MVRIGTGMRRRGKMETVRKIVRIDEDKCNGCGQCADACAEGAIQIIDGKARLVNESHCDGLGACIGECPQGAITLKEKRTKTHAGQAASHHKAHLDKTTKCNCPSMQIAQFDRETALPESKRANSKSMLGHWPVQLALVPPGAPFLQGAELLLVSDCVPFAYSDFHRDFLRGRSVLVACPKLDDAQAHLDRLTQILRKSKISIMTVARMEVPCCSGLTAIAKKATEISGKDIQLKEIIVNIGGDIRKV